MIRTFRPLALAAVLAIAVAACGGDDEGSATSLAPLDPGVEESTTVVGAGFSTLYEIPGVDILLEVPNDWVVPLEPPRTVAQVFYAPSDNDPITQRLTVEGGLLDLGADLELYANRLAADLATTYGPGSVDERLDTTVGDRETPAKLVTFEWSRGAESGSGHAWVVLSSAQEITLIYYGSDAATDIYLPVVEEMIATAIINE